MRGARGARDVRSGHGSHGGVRRRGPCRISPNAELSRVLVSAIAVLDQLDAVAAGVRFERTVGSPDVGSAVGNSLGDGLQRNHVLAWPTEKHERDGAGACGLIGMHVSYMQSGAFRARE